MVEIFGARMVVHFSPKNLGLNVEFSRLFLNRLGLFLDMPELNF